MLDHGSLAKAMQASMSIPVPSSRWTGTATSRRWWHGQQHAGGRGQGHAGADVVIAVDIGAKLRTRSPSVGIGHDRSAHHLRDPGGTEKQKALLGPRDILLTPSSATWGSPTSP